MDRRAFEKLIAPYEQVVVDVGTGDGLFIYHRARLNPRTFFIGIDANRRPLQKISEKIYRKPSKGGLPNVLFVQSSVESLPDELENVAGEVYVNFPWGSLLSGVLGSHAEGLANLKRLCAAHGLLQILVGFDEGRDRTEIERLQLPSLSSEHLATTLASHYQRAGLEIIECEVGPFEEATVETSWSRRLSGNKNRLVMRLVARARNTIEDL